MVAGEYSHQFRVLGVGALIPPWQFIFILLKEVDSEMGKLLLFCIRRDANVPSFQAAEHVTGVCPREMAKAIQVDALSTLEHRAHATLTGNPFIHENPSSTRHSL